MKLENVTYDVRVLIYADLENSSEAPTDCDGIVIVYSVTDKDSFTFAKTQAFKKLHERLGAVDRGQKNGTGDADGAAVDDSEKAQKVDTKSVEVAETPTRQPEGVGLRVPLLLVGNKVDEAQLARQVKTEEAEALSEELGCVGFYETAAICNANVPKAFQCVLDEIVKTKQTEHKPKDSSSRPSCCVIIWMTGGFTTFFADATRVSNLLWRRASVQRCWLHELGDLCSCLYKWCALSRLRCYYWTWRVLL